MGIRQNIRNLFARASPAVERIKMITETGNGIYAWNGSLFKSDIVRSCVRPKAKAIGKMTAKHVRNDNAGIKINPETYMRFLLDEPNPYTTMQMMLEKMITQMMLNGNAFALIVRDENEYPIEIYPIPALSVEAVYSKSGELFLKFMYINGKTGTFPYSDIIHLRQDFNNQDIFGDNPAPALTSLMDVINTTDQGIIKAVKNSGIIRWLIKYNTPLKSEDIKKNTKTFVDDYLSLESDTLGAAGIDSKSDATQVNPHDYVPNTATINAIAKRVYSFFGTNEKIIQSSYTENEWISYYESEIEPLAIQLSNEFTRKLFSRRERGFGNRIVFEASNLQYASMNTKLSLVQFVDRGMMTPNEVRQILNLAPIESGDVPIRRLDTIPVKETNTNPETGGD